MEIPELIVTLKEQNEKIKQEKIEELDFDKLEQTLKFASERLDKLNKKDNISERILKDYKAEIKRLVLSLSRLRGENANFELIEKTLQNEDLSYEELSSLKKQLQSEFDRSFSTSPVSKAIFPFLHERRAKDKIKEFKV